MRTTNERISEASVPSTPSLNQFVNAVQLHGRPTNTTLPWAYPGISPSLFLATTLAGEARFAQLKEARSGTGPEFRYFATEYPGPPAQSYAARRRRWPDTLASTVSPP